MAAISEPLLGAGARAKNDWAYAGAVTSLNFTGEAQLRRGVAVQIGLDAMASADAGLSRFVDATVRGNAFAEARAGLQYQLPLNLFDQFGLTIGAQAAAQAAAGVEVGLGLSVGDFLNLITQNVDSEGVPLEIVKLLLDEATVGGKFEVHVAAAAMAYAEILIAGEVVKQPGFHVTVDAGLGLAAGVGFGGGLDLGIRDFRKFYGRAVDRTVESVVDGIGRLTRGNADHIMPQVRALAPVASTSFRLAYEIGEYVATKTPGHSPQDSANLSNHCVGIILEEAQRFLFGRFLEAGLRSLERLVVRDVPTLADGVWDSLMPERQALAAVLFRMPEEPFQPTSGNTAYWADLAAKSVTLISRLPSSAAAEVTRGMAILFAASELLTEAVSARVNQAQAYAFAIGGGSVTTTQPRFGSTLATHPAPKIAEHINQVLGRSASHAIDYPDLITYLIDDTAVAMLRSVVPDVDAYLTAFHDPAVGSGLVEVLRVLLQEREAFLPDQSGRRDPQSTLRVFVGLLDAFITNTIQRDLVPAVNQQLADGNTKLFFNEVILGTLLYTKDVTLQTVVNWEQERTLDQSAFTEGLAAVMTMLLGRSLVLVGEGFLAALQGDMRRACQHAANNLESRNDPFQAIGIQASPPLKALFAETLRIGGEVFGPLPDDTRRNLRFVLYDVLETLPPTSAGKADLVTNLSDQFFIPNEESLEELTEQLLAISRARFQLFVERVLEAGAQFTIDGLQDFIELATETVLGWVRQLEEAIRDLQRELAELEQLLQQLEAQARLAFEQATNRLHALLQEFSTPSLRDRLRSNVADAFYQNAKSELTRNAFYRSLPGDLKDVVKGALRQAINNLVGNAVLNPIFDAVGAIAGELDGVLTDVRDLNPHEPLAPQLLDLLVDRMEDGIRDMFGGSKPHIDVGFTASAFGVSHHFSLGRIDLSFSSVFSILRASIDALSFYEAELQSAAAALADAFTKAMTLETKQMERDGKAADRERLATIRAEFTAEPKTITIVNPVQSLVYDDDFGVEIHLGGVPASYLGLNRDEQQRVLIFLNGQLIPSASLALDDPLGDLGSATLHDAIDVTRLTNFHAAQGAFLGNRASIQFSRQPQGATAPPPPLPSLLESSPPLRGSLKSAGTGRFASSSRPMPVTVAQPKGKGLPVTTSALRNVLPGRRMTPTKRAAVGGRLAPGISLEFRVRVQDLVIGTNTLAVVIVDPEGQRYQQVVSFGVVGPRGAVLDGPRLPTFRAGGPGKPAAPRDQVDLHFDAKAMGDRLAKGHEFVVQHANKHFRAPEPRRRGGPA